MSILNHDIKEKVESTRKILHLAKSPDHMQDLLSNEALMNAFARVLREDWQT